LIGTYRFHRDTRRVQRRFSRLAPATAGRVAVGLTPGGLRTLELAEVEGVLEISGDPRWASSLLCAVAAQLGTGLSGMEDAEVLITAGVHPQFAGPSLPAVLTGLEQSIGTDPGLPGPERLTVVVCGILDDDEVERISVLHQKVTHLRFVTIGPYPATRWRLPLNADGLIVAPELGLSADAGALEHGIARVLRRRSRHPARPVAAPAPAPAPAPVPVVAESPAVDTEPAPAAENASSPELPAPPELLAPAQLYAPSAAPTLPETPQPPEQPEAAPILTFAEAFALVPESIHRPLTGLLGLDDADGSPLLVDLSGPAHAFMIAGPAGSGRSNTLATLAVSLLATGTKLIVILPQESELHRLAVHPYVQLHLGPDPDPALLTEQLEAAGGPVAILLDDADRLGPEHPLDPVLRDVVDTGRERGIGLVYAGSGPAIEQAVDWMQAAAASRQGVLLAPQDGRDSGLLALDLALDPAGGAVGRGYTPGGPGDGARLVVIPLTELR
jgi:Mrp family chromosome partitioning ATPase